MLLFPIAFGVCALFVCAYFIYGRYLGTYVSLDDAKKTPACEINDGVDYVPAPKAFLLAQHFSAIAAAGPVVGPILAGIWFGWLPALCWIAVGAIFFGAVHDFSALAGSVKHKAVSIVEIVEIHLGRKAYLFFLAFVWLSLIYVITAFTDLTSGSFAEPALGGGVATSSFFYLLISVIMGLALYKWKMPLGPVTWVAMPLVVLSIWFGQYVPMKLSEIAGLSPQQIWNMILLIYCLLASVTPVWALLQPRGYLGGFFLYVTLAMGIIGLFLGGEKIEYPAFLGFTNEKGLPLFPILFVTIACGACSGFHGIVGSGTTSKQIAKESDCKLVGYGAMLLEGLVALIALSTVMILVKNDPLLASSPDRIYAEGLSRFVQNFGIPRDFAISFTLLAFTTFIFDTLDVATRLARTIFQELTGWKDARGRILATVLSLALPLVCVSMKVLDAQGNLVPVWKVFWTIFGTSNQLLAALTLMILSLWLAKSGKAWWMSGVPMFFMFAVTLTSLFLMICPAVQKIFSGSGLDFPGAVAILLFGLALMLMTECAKTVWAARDSKSSR